MSDIRQHPDDLHELAQNRAAGQVRREHAGRVRAVTHDEAVAALSAAPLFADLPVDLVRRLAERVVERRYPRGASVFLRGDSGEAMYLVLDGMLKVYDASADGNELLLATVPPGGTVGELALADGGPRSASVAAVQPSRVLVLGRHEFLDLVRNHGVVAEPLLRYLAAQLRRLTDFTSDLVFLELPDRVAKLLLALARSDGRRVPDGLLLDVRLTQSELAAMVGASRQSLNTVLNRFARQGLLELRRRQILLLRPDLLADGANAVRVTR